MTPRLNGFVIPARRPQIKEMMDIKDKLIHDEISESIGEPLEAQSTVAEMELTRKATVRGVSADYLWLDNYYKKKYDHELRRLKSKVNRLVTENECLSDELSYFRKRKIDTVDEYD